MSEIEVHASPGGQTIRVGTLFRQAARGRGAVTFERCDKRAVARQGHRMRHAFHR